MTPIGLEPRGGSDHCDRSDLARHAHWRSGVQAKRLSRRADEHDVADPAAIDRRRGASADRRSAHSRTARRIHVLRRRCAGARGHLRLAQRAVRSRGRQPDHVPDRRMGRRVRQQECGDRERDDEDSVGRISRRRQQLRRHVRPLDDRRSVIIQRTDAEHERRTTVRGASTSPARASHRTCASSRWCSITGGNKIINFHNSGNDCVRIREAPVHAERARRRVARGELVANEVRRSVRLDRRRTLRRSPARRQQLPESRLAPPVRDARERRRAVGAIHRTIRATREPELQPERDRRSAVRVLSRHDALSICPSSGASTRTASRPTTRCIRRTRSSSRWARCRRSRTATKTSSPSPRRAPPVQHRTPDCPVMTSASTHRPRIRRSSRRDSRRRPL